MDFILSYGNYLLMPLHVVVCLILIGVVLLQTGKGTDWAGVFGGSGSQAAFGPRGVENTLSRLTKIAAVVFMVTSLSISLIQSKRRPSALPDLPEAEKTAPAATPTPAEPSAAEPVAPVVPAEPAAATGEEPAAPAATASPESP